MRSEPTEKLRPTGFDYLAAALAPALIIGMVGSLVFFLVIAFYRGQYDLRLMYILGLFTLATVLIARIAIESGRAYANAFALPLAIVAVIAMFRFVSVPGGWELVGWVLNIGLLALVWFLADRITFDCTLVEENRQSVQGGLLQTLGVRAHGELPTATVAPSKPSVDAKKRPKHNPGVWVLYFALLAFPLFGLGQLAIPDAAERSKAFWLLVAYLGCALGLLTTTSLLALRRYLRQRGVEMPAEITARWLSAGAGVALAVLLACMLLPLPGRSLGLIGLPFEITSPDNLTTSRYGIGNDGQENEPHGAPQSQEQPSDEPSQADGKAGKPSDEAQNGDAGNKGNQSQNSKDGKSAPQGQQEPSGRQDQSAQQEQQQGQQSRQPNQTSQPGKNSQTSEQPRPPDSQQNKPAPDESARDQQPERPEENAPEEDLNRPANDRRLPEQARDPTQPQDDPTERPPGEPAEQTPSDSPAASRSPSYNITQHFPDFGGSLSQWFKWLTIALLVVIIIVYAVTHPGEIARLWRGLLDFLALLFGGKRAGRTGADAAANATPSGRPPRPRFAQFANPFAQNLRGWQAAQVVEHTFAALEAWAAEHGQARHVDQTAEEFAKRLVVQVPQLAKLPPVAASMLDRVMFAGWQPTSSDLAPLADLWRRLQSLDFLSTEDG